MDAKIIDFQKAKKEITERSESDAEPFDIQDVFEFMTDEEIEYVLQELIEAFAIQDGVILTPANDEDEEFTFSIYFVDSDDEDSEDDYGF